MESVPIGKTLHFLGSVTKIHQVPHILCLRHSRCCSQKAWQARRKACRQSYITFFSQEEWLNSHLPSS